MKRTALVTLVVLTGCISLQRDAPQTTRYVLDVARPDGERGDGAGPRLEVRAFHGAAAYGGTKLVYRTGASTVDVDFYHEWFVPPALALTDLTRDWLAASGRFETVRGAGGPLAADWVLDADLVALYGDDRGGEHAAVLDLHVIVVDALERTLVLERSYAAREPTADGQPATLVAGFERAAATVLGRLERDLENAR